MRKHFNIQKWQTLSLKSHENTTETHNSLDMIWKISHVLSYEYGIINLINIIWNKQHIYEIYSPLSPHTLQVQVWILSTWSFSMSIWQNICPLLCSWSPHCSAGAALPLCTTAPWGTPSFSWWFTHWILLERVRALQCLNPHNDISLSKHCMKRYKFHFWWFKGIVHPEITILSSFIMDECFNCFCNQWGTEQYWN